MNTAAQPITQEHLIADANNKAMHCMALCALAAMSGLDALGISIIRVMVHGSKPVIDITAAPANHNLTTFNSTDWQMHQDFCPIRKQKFIQTFANYRGCLVTWITWR